MRIHFIFYYIICTQTQHISSTLEDCDSQWILRFRHAKDKSFFTTTQCLCVCCRSHRIYIFYWKIIIVKQQFGGLCKWCQTDDDSFQMHNDRQLFSVRLKIVIVVIVINAAYTVCCVTIASALQYFIHMANSHVHCAYVTFNYSLFLMRSSASHWPIWTPNETTGISWPTRTNVPTHRHVKYQNKK